MENLGLGLLLMCVGMVTVFAILLLVIYGSELLIKLVNVIARRSDEKETPDDVMAVLTEAVKTLTDGKGRISNVTKL